MADKYILYAHIFPNEKVYIGITKTDPCRRWANGLGYRKQKKVYRAILKYGWNNIKHIVIFKNLTQLQAECMEVAMIKKYKSTDKRYGYNSSPGGNLRAPMSEDTKLKLSRANKGKEIPEQVRRRISESTSGSKAYWYGKHHSEESKEKNRTAHLGVNNFRFGKPIDDDTREKISIKMTGNENAPQKLTLCIETGEIFRSSREASRVKNIRGISMCCRGERLTAGGYHWRYVEEVIQYG